VTMCTPEAQAKYHEAGVWAHKDKSSGTDSAQKAESRKDLDYHERLPGADQWERGGELYEYVRQPPTRMHCRTRHHLTTHTAMSTTDLICACSSLSCVAGAGACEQERGGGEAGRHSQSAQG